jgi:hypothetical protein
MAAELVGRAVDDMRDQRHCDDDNRYDNRREIPRYRRRAFSRRGHRGQVLARPDDDEGWSRRRAAAMVQEEVLG